jgi:hypothetical protein
VLLTKELKLLSHVTAIFQSRTVPSSDAVDDRMEWRDVRWKDSLPDRSSGHVNVVCV